MDVSSGDSILRILVEKKEALASRFSVTKIALFGSFARGDDHADSDVDILVEFSEPTFDNYMDLKFYLEDILERPVDLVMADTVKARIQSAIECEALYA